MTYGRLHPYKHSLPTRYGLVLLTAVVLAPTVVFLVMLAARVAAMGIWDASAMTLLVAAVVGALGYLCVRYALARGMTARTHAALDHANAAGVSILPQR